MVVVVFVLAIPMFVLVVHVFVLVVHVFVLVVHVFVLVVAIFVLVFGGIYIYICIGNIHILFVVQICILAMPILY